MLVKNKDIYFMKQAVLQACKAFAINEVPIGAILVDQYGKVVARGYNQVEKKESQLAHAEMLAMQKASKKLKSWRLLKTTLYVTVQPCMMCLGALYLSRIDRVVYGVASPKYGVSLQEFENCGIYKNLSMNIECVGDEASLKLLQQFFKKKRSVKDVKKGRVRKN